MVESHDSRQKKKKKNINVFVFCETYLHLSVFTENEIAAEVFMKAIDGNYYH